PFPYPQPEWRDPFPLEVKYHDVSVTVDGLIAKTKVDQVFFNPLNYRLEGQYIFPVPEGAVITSFKMFVDGKELKAELLDAEKAKKLYQEIVAKSKDPALLEFTGRNIYTLKIFPIEPRSDRRIIIEYVQNLEYDNGTVRYLYPLNTEKFSAKPLQRVSVKTEITSKNRILSLYSPTHETKSERKDDNHFTALYEEKNVKPDKDYLLIINTSAKGSVADLMIRKDEDGKEFFLLTFTPDDSEFPVEYIPKDVVFVLDVSGSMAGEKLQAAQDALIYCISRLKDKDRLQIIQFGTEAKKLFPALVPVDKTQKESALDKIRKMEALGGTNIEEALQLALEEKPASNRPFYIVFITDGKPTIGERDENKLLATVDQKALAGKKIFTFGIGYDINILLLDKLAQKSGGVRNYSPPNSEVEIAISNFFNKIESPVLTDITLSTYGGLKTELTYPNQKFDLYKGSVAVFAGLIEGEGKFRITGKRNGKEFSFDVATNKPNEGDYEFIPVIWAMRRTGYLLDLIRLNGESKELKDEIIYLSKKYGLITPYTAFLILEDEQVTQTQRPPLAPKFKDTGGWADPIPDAFKTGFEGLKAGEGKESATASEKVRDYSSADELNHRDIEKRASDPALDGSGSAPKITDAAGRAFYNNNGLWIDSFLDSFKGNQVKKIEFGSSEYYELAFSNKNIAKILSVGRNVRFVANGEAIEIVN
ncbi:MAG: hypothetical protein B6D45_02105, partial [Ignavibacteriales bacterium UTCHB3]